MPGFSHPNGFVSVYARPAQSPTLHTRTRTPHAHQHPHQPSPPQMSVAYHTRHTTRKTARSIREALITSPRRYSGTQFTFFTRTQVRILTLLRCSVMSSRTPRQDTGAHINADYFPINHTVQYNTQSTPRRLTNNEG
jgi:hypothetical protein